VCIVNSCLRRISCGFYSYTVSFSSEAVLADHCVLLTIYRCIDVFQLSNANWNFSELDLVELNEAFAAQSVAVLRELGLDPNKVCSCYTLDKILSAMNKLLSAVFNDGQMLIEASCCR
jgi:hypothetical protein